MARAVSTRRTVAFTIAAWIIALVIFFPILYTIITSLKTEREAIAGLSLIPSFTLENYVLVQTQNGYFKPFMNSVVIAVGSTLIALAIAVPAAWSMAFSLRADPDPVESPDRVKMLAKAMPRDVAVSQGERERLLAGLQNAGRAIGRDRETGRQLVQPHQGHRLGL